MSIIGEKIKAIRDERRWSLEDLATLSGVDRQTIHRIESGEVERPRRSTLEKLSAAFGASTHLRENPRPVEGSRAAIYGVGGGARVEDLLSELLGYIRSLKGKNRSEFISAVVALLTALEHTRPAAGSGTPSDDGR